jgi:hypothetical protein
LKREDVLLFALGPPVDVLLAALTLAMAGLMLKLLDSAMLSNNLVKNSEASSCLPTTNTLEISFFLEEEETKIQTNIFGHF